MDGNHQVRTLKLPFWGSGPEFGKRLVPVRSQEVELPHYDARDEVVPPTTPALWYRVPYIFTTPPGPTFPLF